MLKKIIILALCFMPLCAFAQQLKFGHINLQEVFTALPEKATADKSLQDLATSYENELNKMRDEYSKKVKEFVDKKDSMPQSVLQARQSEIVDMEQRITTLNQTAQADFSKKQQELYQPLIDKVKKAIDAVGLENGFTYIFDLSVQSILYHSDQSVDVLPLVKKKLNIK
jgi:outer membrane protein